MEKLYLTGYTGQPPRREIAKVAIGAEEWVAWEHHADPLPTIRQLLKDGWQVVALEIDPAAMPLSSFVPADRVCLAVGHELSGVPEELRALCATTVCIPMLGKKESLNVAVAAGIALHELRAH